MRTNASAKGVLDVELASKVATQVIVMFLLIAVGYICDKVGLVTKRGIKQMTDIVLLIVSPAVIIQSYNQEFDPNLAKNLGIAFVYATIAHAGMIVFSRFLFSKKNPGKYNIDRVCSIYTNSGFMGIPLILSVLGEEGVFYGSAFLALFNITLWTQGVAAIKGRQKEKAKPAAIAKQLLLNPGVIGILIGFLIFFTPISLPDPVGQAVGHIANLNTPLAMIVIGTYIARSNILQALKEIRIYYTSLIRLVVFPLLMIPIYLLLPSDSLVYLTNFIAMACPAAAATSMLAAKYGGDAIYASKIIAISTVLSVLTIPLMVIVIGFVL